MAWNNRVCIHTDLSGILCSQSKNTHTPSFEPHSLFGISRGRTDWQRETTLNLSCAKQADRRLQGLLSKTLGLS